MQNALADMIIAYMRERQANQKPQAQIDAESRSGGVFGQDKNQWEKGIYGVDLAQHRRNIYKQVYPNIPFDDAYKLAAMVDDAAKQGDWWKVNKLKGILSDNFGVTDYTPKGFLPNKPTKEDFYPD